MTKADEKNERGASTLYDCENIRKWFLAAIVLVLASLSSQCQTVTQSTLHTFSGPTDGDFPAIGLVQGPDGFMYGSAADGGSAGYGTIFKLSESGEFSVIYDFPGGAGGFGGSILTVGPDGALYGTADAGGTSETCTGGFGCGYAFRVTGTGDFSNLHNFNVSEGQQAYAPLALADDGNFYGVAPLGGAHGDGSIFRLNPSGTLSVIYDFTGGSDGFGAELAGLVQASDGYLYGVSGGTRPGTVFRLSTSGDFEILYTFPDGSSTPDVPISSFVEGADGFLYGTSTDLTPTGLGLGQGSVYEISKSGQVGDMHDFTGKADGGMPIGPVVLAGDGNFYGTTFAGGDENTCVGGSEAGCGTLFAISSAGQFSSPFDFQELPPDGFGPLLEADDGSLVGASAETVYALRFTPSLNRAVQLVLSSSSITLGTPAELTWTVTNAFSKTMQQCYAFVQGSATGAGIWAGAQTGILSSAGYTGSAELVPMAAGTYTYALTCGGTESGFAKLTVAAPVPLQISTSSLPNGQVGTAYSATLVATGGTPPYTWSVGGGQLPGGLSLSAGSGSVSGTPSVAGTFTFTAEVTDGSGANATRQFSVQIQAPAPILTIAPSVLNISSTDLGTVTLTLSNFKSSQVSLGCSGLPPGILCSFGSISGNGNPSTAILTVSKAATAQKINGMLLATLLLPFSFVRARKRRLMRGGLLCVVFFLGGCGGSPSSGNTTQTTTITINATESGQVASANLQLKF